MPIDLSYLVERDDIIDITTHIVTEHVTNNTVSVVELCDLIESVFTKFTALSANQPALTYKEFM